MKRFALFAIAAAAAAQQKYDLLLDNGHVIDPKNNIDRVMDVAVADGKVALVAPAIQPSDARRVVNVGGLYVTPGLIDLHVHVYMRPEMGSPSSSVQPDAHSFRSGVTTVVDAGTSGWKDFAGFRKRVIDPARTRVLALLNISSVGMGAGKEDDPKAFDIEGLVRTARENKDVVVGIKSAHYAGPGWESVEAAVKAGNQAGLPVMVDFGYLNKIRNISTLLLDKLRPGDIYTHCYSGHREEILDDGKVNPAMVAARKRGVLFDVGHGAGSFYWYVAIPAYAQGFPPDTISTDLHTGSMNAGMKDMTNVMAKILNLGSPIGDVIRMSTWSAASAIKRPDLGHLTAGGEADIAVLRVDNGDFGFIDSAGAGHRGRRNIVCELTLRKGRPVWDLNARAAENWQSFPYQKKPWTK